MDTLDERLRMARARNELSALEDETAVEEDLAALYLCMSAKKLGELRAKDGGPKFIKPTEANSPLCQTVVRQLHQSN
ncbi:hypothetical protein [Massilia sp. TSP1-1-2]|uniref:hypothetical protein n=1 Tax=Massilia sp. TSP1-1-2 TaxID=2804649 RepID=UPI003CE6909B